MRTDLERKRHVRGVRPTILFPVQPGHRLARVAGVERDQVVVSGKPGVLELRGEPGRVEKLGVEQEDGGPGGIEAADGARCGIGGVPEGDVVVVGVGEVDVRHFGGVVAGERLQRLHARGGSTSTDASWSLINESPTLR